ncbi:uncharacterized protein LOC125047669 [Penaeus chinensis]|uniref:uncharacterized protein LOC125047669 n=1 Tax=Penaeus chinensis TaxID=139456 RepID=UPI001FB6F9A7|nr:uncharacterized protein LOC125047669 [Penaeus chinensis]
MSSAPKVHTAIAVLCVVAVSVTAGGVDSLQRVGVTSLSRLLALASDVEPHSCWCGEPFVSCPVFVPQAPLHQLLNLTCDPDKVHCCLERITNLDEDGILPFNATGDITTVEEFRDFLKSVVDLLMPRNSGVVNDLPPAEGSSQQEYLRSLSVLDSAGTHLEASPGNLEEEPGVESGRQNFGFGRRQEPNDEINSIYSDTNTETISLTDQQVYEHGYPEGSSSNEKNGNDPLFHAIKGLTKFLLNSEKQTILDHESEEHGITAEHNTTLISDKVDVLKYSRLGWFSRAVEYAIDGSLYIGVALAVMYFTSMILSGLISTVGSICFMCAILDSTELAAIA